MIFAIILYALFSTIFIVAKVALRYGAPIFMTGVRMSVAGILILAYQHVRHKKITIEKQQVWPLIWLTVFNIFLSNVLEFWGLQYLISAKACFIYNISPFVSAFICSLFFKERLTKIQWIALVAGFLGFIPLLLTDSSAEQTVGGIGFLSWPELALLGAAIAAVVGWIAMKELVKQNHSPVTANGISMLAGGIIAFAASPIFERWDPVPVFSWWPFIGWLIPIIIISNLICYNLYGILLRKYSATLMSFVGFTSPFFTALFGWIFLNEVVTWQFFFSATIVFGALYLYYYQEIEA